MATSISVKPNLVLSPFPHRTATENPLFHRTLFGRKPFFRGSLSVARFGPRPDLESSDGVIKELFGLFGRAENLLFTIADATVSSSDNITTTKQNSDWLSGITNVMETILKVLKDGLSTLHVPYSYGFAIILLTVLVKAATFPLTTKQVESAMAMRSLAPQVKAVQERYAGDQERIQLETARLYKLAGINPLAGCLPTLATIPVWIGLYRALSNVANEGLLTEGFFWIPSLAGPTTIATRQSGSGISWLFPFVDGHPPLGWSDTLAYLVLPMLLVVSQYISYQIMQSSQSNDPNMKSSQTVTKFLPLMIGYFSLSVPSGLSLYWFTNNILSTAQQIWLQKFGGAKNPMKQVSDVMKEDQVDILKSFPGLNSTRKETGRREDLTAEGLRPGDRFKQIKELEVKQGEKLTAEGLQPGDRFKQIKEQEARRRQQREEEKRKAAEVAANRSQTSNEGDERETNVQERPNGTGTDLIDEKNENFQSLKVQDVSNIGVIVNGNTSGLEFKDDKTISGLRTEDSEVSTSSLVNGKDEQQSFENIEKEAVELHTTSDEKPFEEGAHGARRE